ncbi:hypothetical protein POM88_001420 [Heracleum sosnowskyi]|uniref:non-specific serine/threonine protein kinase n=1 Tax=Heracleum sosnowskyi TaxID=360622 RepID=A0AAD8JG34_9APIA|nr:hypothetical protein POM88_001418 [Heracleum sosnowskyi]KAK1401815.1 hypothetical protein POM88_001420 [Heracleum sosnowskyi]
MLNLSSWSSITICCKHFISFQTIDQANRDYSTYDDGSDENGSDDVGADDDGRGVQPIPWATRVHIATDVARGISFLHNLDSNVIYRDLKASNILLDSDFNAKLSDFGYARAGPSGDRTHVSTRVVGTKGYAAPEYVATGQ